MVIQIVSQYVVSPTGAITFSGLNTSGGANDFRYEAVKAMMEQE